MRRCVLLFLVIVNLHHRLYAQESAQYLQNAIRDLRNSHGRQQTIVTDDDNNNDNNNNNNIIPNDVLPEQSAEIQQFAEKRIQNNGVPPLSLTKGELTAIYNAALSKGDTVNLKTGDNSYIQAALHEIDDKSVDADKSHDNDDNKDDTTGYYYYYFPIKSFLDEMTSQPSTPEKHYSSPPNNHDYRDDPDKPQYQYHSHMHHHNIKIVSDVNNDKNKGKKGIEPLFVAMSGFIGMAIMFILSVIVLPKFSMKKPPIKKNERISDIARVALQAIEGKDCTERFACELEKTARTFNVQDNRFIKLFKRLAPNFGKQMDKVGRYGTKRLRCTAIPCKNKNNNNNNQNKKKAKTSTAQKKH